MTAFTHDNAHPDPDDDLSEEDSRYPPFDQEAFEKAWFMRNTGGGYGSPEDF